MEIQRKDFPLEMGSGVLLLKFFQNCSAHCRISKRACQVTEVVQFDFEDLRVVSSHFLFHNIHLLANAESLVFTKNLLGDFPVQFNPLENPFCTLLEFNQLSAVERLFKWKHLNTDSLRSYVF